MKNKKKDKEKEKFKPVKFATELGSGSYQTTVNQAGEISFALSITIDAPHEMVKGTVFVSGGRETEIYGCSWAHASTTVWCASAVSDHSLSVWHKDSILDPKIT